MVDDGVASRSVEPGGRVVDAVQGAGGDAAHEHVLGDVGGQSWSPTRAATKARSRSSVSAQLASSARRSAGPRRRACLRSSPNCADERTSKRTQHRASAASIEVLVRHPCRPPGRARRTKETSDGTSRVQLALNVTDIDAATPFYRDLFGVDPAKQRPGYANFEIADPPLKLVLFEQPGATSPLNHLGVEVADRRRGRRRRRAVRRRRAQPHDDRGGPLLPRRAGQGVGRRPRRPARRLGVLHRPRRRPRPAATGLGEHVLHDDVDRHRAVLRRRPEDVTWQSRPLGRRRRRGRRTSPRRHAGPRRHRPATSRRAPRSACSATTGPARPRLIRVLTTLIRPDRGRVVIDGFDVVADPDRGAPPHRGHRPVRRPRRLPHRPARTSSWSAAWPGCGTAARGRAGELVDRLELDDIAARRVGELSGGSRRRVDLAASLVGLTVGAVPRRADHRSRPRRPPALWEVVAELTAAGTTVVLTTQYLEEADRLADHIVVLDHGRVAARGTPAELKRSSAARSSRATIPRTASSAAAPPRRRPNLSTTDDVEVGLHAGRRRRPPPQLVAATRRRQASTITDLDVTSPSLDDVFSHLATHRSPA